ncbi:MAG: LacI family DNA-binding transcriptional regulator [Chthoniobacterales bacterium]
MSSPLTRPPTQAEVAALAKVSREAVSHILGGKRANLFSEKTRKKVKAAAQQLGYYPHQGAQAMRRGSSNLIVFLHMAGQSELVAQQAYHTGRLVHENGFNYQTVDAFWWVGEGQKIIERVLSLKPEGIIIAGSPQAIIDFQAFRGAGIPIVTLNTEIADTFEIRHDVSSAISKLTVACFDTGKTRPMLLLVKDVPDNYISWQQRDRKKGFLSALKKLRLPPPQEFILQNVQKIPDLDGPAIGYIDTKRHAYFSIYEPGRMAAECIGTAADAIIASNDNIAVGLLTHYLRNNIDVPGEVAISGFDDVSAAIQGKVFLTSVEHPTEKMCEAAMTVLLGQISKKQQRVDQKTFPCKVIWRESLPAPAKKRKTKKVLK